MNRSKALQKYLSKNSKSDQASKGNKNQIKIFDPDLEEKKSDFSEGIKFNLKFRKNTFEQKNYDYFF